MRVDMPWIIVYYVIYVRLYNCQLIFFEQLFNNFQQEVCILSDDSPIQLWYASSPSDLLIKFDVSSRQNEISDKPN